MVERLYQIEHPKVVAAFDEVNDVEEGSEGFWISKSWLKGLLGFSDVNLLRSSPNVHRLEIGKAEDAQPLGRRSATGCS